MDFIFSSTKVEANLLLPQYRFEFVEEQDLPVDWDSNFKATNVSS